MNTNEEMLTDISAELDKEFGAPGTPERAKFDEEAYAFYTSQILLDARKEACRPPQRDKIVHLTD